MAPYLFIIVGLLMLSQDPVVCNVIRPPTSPGTISSALISKNDDRSVQRQTVTFNVPYSQYPQYRPGQEINAHCVVIVIQLTLLYHYCNRKQITNIDQSMMLF